MSTLTSYCVLFLLSFCVLWYIYHFRPKLRKMSVRSFDGRCTPQGIEFMSAITKGTATLPGRIFKLNTTNHETVILPAEYIDFVKGAPEHNFSLGMELYERQLGRFTRIGTVGRATGFVNSIRMDLNRNLSQTLGPLRGEVEYAVKNEIGPCHSWTSIPVHHRALRMVAVLTGRVFVGPELNRNEEWISSSIQTTVDTFSAAFGLWNHHWAVRPILAFFSPQIRNIYKQQKKTARLLKLIVVERLQALQSTGFKPPVDLVQFFLQNLSSHDIFYQSQLHSAVNVAAIHTTSMNVTHVLFDLATYPEYQNPLREEIDQVLSGCDEDLHKNALAKLKKLDSFLRESQRLNPPGIVSMSRMVKSDTLLPDGTVLPKGCLVACDSWSATRDPALWDHPESFDGFRFAKLRTTPGNEGKYQFVTTSPTNMAFGHGHHSCPGRFFVANEIKILIAHILLHYDLKLQEGASRPESSYNNIMILPDMNAEVLFRRR